MSGRPVAIKPVALRYSAKIMPIPQPSPGDSYLLFHELLYDFDTDLPLVIGPNIYLDKTPQQSVLDLVNPSAWADFVLPGYHCIPGITHCCLRCPASETRPTGLEPSDLFFLAIPALRLRAPLAIEVAGQFELGTNEDLIKNPTLYELMSPGQPDHTAHYSGEDIRFTDKIARRLLDVSQGSYHRLNSAIVLFSQVTCGHSKSFQMAYLALFASLDALFAPSGNKAKTIARRVANFLSGFQFPCSLKDWLEEEYKNERNNLAHGIQDVVPWTRTRPQRIEAFGRLHEITRLCILGFLSLNDTKLASLSQRTGQPIQSEIDGLSPASGLFLEGQRFWLAAES